MGAVRSGESCGDVAQDLHGAGVALAHPHAALLVDEQGVVLDHQVVLQDALGAHQHLQHVLGGPQALVQVPQRLVDLVDLLDKAGKQRDPVRAPPWAVSIQMGPLGTGFPPSAHPG